MKKNVLLFIVITAHTNNQQGRCLKTDHLQLEAHRLIILPHNIPPAVEGLEDVNLAENRLDVDAAH